jgi:hypothetical protein
VTVIFDRISGTVSQVHNNRTEPWGMTVTSANQVVCPDRLDHTKIGEADNLRGRVVRAFFFLMRLWPVR